MITEVDLYNMFPFSAYLTHFEMIGAEVLLMLTLIQNDTKISPTNGVVQSFRNNKEKFHLIIAKLFDGIVEKPMSRLRIISREKW